MGLREYQPGTAFNGVIGRTFDVSQPAWPRPLRAKEGAPNVLFIILDDASFGQLGCNGNIPFANGFLSLLIAGAQYRHLTGQMKPEQKRHFSLTLVSPVLS
jgi:hypothetical protein